MANLCGGILCVTGKKSDLIRFTTAACHAVVLEDGNAVAIKDLQYVSGTHGGFVYSNEPIEFYRSEPTFIIDDIYSLYIPFEQKWDIRGDNLKNLSRMYHVDFDISAYEPGFDFNRHVKVVSGKILVNEYRKGNTFTDTEERSSQFQQSDSVGYEERAENALSTQQREDAESADKLKTKLIKIQDEIIKTVAEEQKRRFISKCPCCGHDNMYSANGTTYHSLSNSADIYICSFCQSHEQDPFHTNLPLHQWAVFNSTNIDAFLKSEEIQPSDQCNDYHILNCVQAI